MAQGNNHGYLVVYNMLLLEEIIWAYHLALLYNPYYSQRVVSRETISSQW